MKRFILMMAVFTYTTSSFAIDSKKMILAAEQTRGEKFMISAEHEVISIVPANENIENTIDDIFSSGNKLIYECDVKFQRLNTQESSALVYSIKACKTIQ